jgi:hypothetical protein
VVVSTAESAPEAAVVAPVDASCTSALFLLPNMRDDDWEAVSNDAFATAANARYDGQFAELIAGLPSGYCVAQNGSSLFVILVPSGLDNALAAELAATTGLELVQETDNEGQVGQFYDKPFDESGLGQVAFLSGPWVVATGMPDAFEVTLNP